MLKKLLSILLVLALMVQLLPAGVFADSGEKTAEPNAEQEYTVLGEKAALREEHVKHFSLSDGQSIAVSYPLPVHYGENGAWQQIDNTLVDAGEGYENKANSLHVYLPGVYDSDHGVHTGHGNHEVSFVLRETAPSVGMEEKYAEEYTTELEEATQIDGA